MPCREVCGRQVALLDLCGWPEVEVRLRDVASPVGMPVVTEYLSLCGVQERIYVANRDQRVPPSIDAHQFECSKVLPDLQLKPHAGQVDRADGKRKCPALVWPAFAANP